MPRTDTATPEDLRARADALAMQAAEAQAALDAADAQERAKEHEEQLNRDRASVESYNRAALDRRVADALTELEAAIEAMPVTHALAAYVHAQNSRTWAWSDQNNALARLGMNPQGQSTYPDTSLPMPLADYITAVANRIAQQRTDADRQGII